MPPARACHGAVPDQADVGTSLNDLVVLYERQGRYAEAAQLSPRALAIAETALGPDHPRVGTHLNGPLCGGRAAVPA